MDTLLGVYTLHGHNFPLIFNVCSRQHVAVRGHMEGETSTNRKSSELLHFRGESGDETLNHQFQTASRTAVYMFSRF